MEGRIEFDTLPGAASREVITSSDRRVGVIIYPPETGKVTISNDPVLAEGSGLVLAAGGPPLKLWEGYHGEIVRRSFHFWYSAGATGAAFVQVLR